MKARHKQLDKQHGINATKHHLAIQAIMDSYSKETKTQMDAYYNNLAKKRPLKAW